MKKFDTRHIVFHILIALYVIWLAVFTTLLSVAITNAYTQGNAELMRVLMIWIFLNLFMGSVLFIVIRLYRNASVLNRLVLYSYICMGAAAIGTLLLIRYLV